MYSNMSNTDESILIKKYINYWTIPTEQHMSYLIM